MLIVMDYDETYTEDPSIWDAFILLLRTRGHTIICCTMRDEEACDNTDIIRHMSALQIEIIYAAQYQDKWEAVQEAGYHPENAIWIDDRPMYIYMNRNFEEIDQ